MSDFEDLFGHRHKHHGNHHDHERRYNHEHEHKHENKYPDLLRRHGEHFKHHGHDFHIGKQLGKTLLQSKLFLPVLGGCLLLIIAGVIMAIVVLQPLLADAFSYISTHGLKGVVDSILQILQKMWQGGGSGTNV